MTRGFIFDLDGTLLDTLASLAASFNRALASAGFPPHPVDAYRHFVGDGQRKCVERALPPSALNETTIQVVIRAQQEDYQKAWKDLAGPYDGIPELLETLENGGNKLAVLSNKNHPFAVRCVEHFFPGTHFDAIQGYTGDIPLKPDPTGALKVAKELGLGVDEIVFVGDTATDIETANACEMTSVGVLWGFRDARELSAAGATHIISHPAELPVVTGVTTTSTANRAREE